MLQSMGRKVRHDLLTKQQEHHQQRVLSLQHCHVILVRNKILRRKELTKMSIPGSRASLESILKAAYHRNPN